CEPPSISVALGPLLRRSDGIGVGRGPLLPGLALRVARGFPVSTAVGVLGGGVLIGRRLPVVRGGEIESVERNAAGALRLFRRVMLAAQELRLGAGQLRRLLVLHGTSRGVACFTFLRRRPHLSRARLLEVVLPERCG